MNNFRHPTHIIYILKIVKGNMQLTNLSYKLEIN